MEEPGGGGGGGIAGDLEQSNPATVEGAAGRGLKTYFWPTETYWTNLPQHKLADR